MILCSHNTMSYRRPKEWYLWPVRFMSQCQQCDYKTQHEKYGVNCFDLRLFWDKNGNVEFRHGGCSFDASDFNEILKYCEDEGIEMGIGSEEEDDIREEFYNDDMVYGCIELDVNKMNEAAKYFEGEHDFKAFKLII